MAVDCKKEVSEVQNMEEKRKTMKRCLAKGNRSSVRVDRRTAKAS